MKENTLSAIVAPVLPGESSPRVENLQDALRLLLDRGAIRSTGRPPGFGADDPASLARPLASERERRTYGSATRRLVESLQRQEGLTDAPFGIVDHHTAEALNRLLNGAGAFGDPGGSGFVVRGRVTTPDQLPVPGLVVRARDRDLRTFQRLGTDGTTDADGRYEIAYTEDQFSRAEKGRADLVVRVFAPETADDPDRPIAESPVLFNAPPVAEINLEVPAVHGQRVPSEFERHVVTTLPLLAGQRTDRGDVPIGSLNDEEVSFVASDTGIDRQQVAWLRTAFAFWAKTRSGSDAHHMTCDGSQVPAAFFYGWFREGLPDRWDELILQPIAALRTAARAAIADRIIPADLDAGLEASLDAVPNPRRQALRSSADAAGVSQAARDALLQHVDDLPEVTNPLVARLVAAGTIASADAHRIGLAAAAHGVAGARPDVTAALLGTKPSRLNGTAPRRARDLGALDAPEIEQALREAKVEPPAGVGLGDYALRIADGIAAAFPTDALLYRVSNVSPAVVAAVDREFKKDGEVANDNQRPATDPELRAFINLHPGLGLPKIVRESSDAGTALSAIRERIGWIDRVRALNPDIDLLAVDYMPGSETLARVKFDGLPEEARAMVASNFKAYQRLRQTGAGTADGLALLKGGYRSATALARSRPSEIAERTGLLEPVAQSYAAQAANRATEAALSWFAFHDLERDAYAVGNRSLMQAPAYLRQLAGYEQLFGSPNFCRCEHCRSVLGPAAYFVDLMFWVERNVLEPSFKTLGGEQHSLHLRSRRSDLWTLQLTCDNTNTVVPTLDLVNDLLERFIVREKGLASSAALYERLATVDSSIRLPFSLPMERLSIVLSHLGISRSEIARAFLRRESDAPVRARIRLNMAPKQFQVITTSRLGDLSAPVIRAAETFYSVWLNANLTLSTIAGQTETRAIGAISVLPFVRASGLDRGAVISVLTSDFVNGSSPGAPARVTPESGIGGAGAVQNDIEVARNLTSGRLDRFERFVRLWRHVPWTAQELDYVIGRLQQRVPVTVAADNRLDEPMLVALADLLDLQDRFQLPVDELCALWDDVPAVALRSDAPLFARVFNMAPFVRQQESWPDAGQSMTDTSAHRARLIAALQVDDQGLNTLVSGLDACLGRASTDALGNPIFVQDRLAHARNLSLLYRHARVAKLLGLTIDEMLQTLALAPALAQKPASERCIAGLSDLRAVLGVHAWRTASGMTLAEIRFIMTAAQSLAGYDTADALAATIAADVAAERSLAIGRDMFTQIGLTQPESEAVITANGALFEQIPGDASYRLRRAIQADDVAGQLVFDNAPSAALVADMARSLYGIVKRSGDTGFEADALVELGLLTAEAAAFVAANLSTAAADGRPFERVPGTTRYRRRAAVTEADAIAAFGASAADQAASRSILKRRAVDLVERHHAEAVLAAKAAAAAKMSPEKTRALLKLAVPSGAPQREALVEALQGGDLATLVATLGRLLRYAVLFKNPAFDAAALDFVRSTPAALSMAEPPTAETVRRVTRYAALASAPDPAYDPAATQPDPAALRSVLEWAASIATAATAQQRGALARAVRAEEPLASDVLAQVAFATGNAIAARIDEVWQLKTAVDLTRRLAVPPETLRLTTADDPAELARGADGAFASVRSKYSDERAFREKIEPFEDKLRSRTRDGLTEYLLSAPDEATTVWRKRFRQADDLYHHFLTDVMVEGCARTSKVVWSISAVQLYAHRVLMNLEQSDETPPTLVARFEDAERARQWSWRKNYQVWVANRKVFLYPENYIEPGLRDDKTPLFRELEDALLQQPITEQSVLDAYSAYLHGFNEVAGLRVAGAYHDRGPADDLLHLFGVTTTEPPVYYYRSIRNLDDPRGPVFSAWQRVDLQIPVKRVSPIVFRGRLYLFWLETSTRQVTEFVDGNSSFVKYRHSVRTKVSQLRLDGRWTAPLTLKVPGDVAAARADVRLVDDPLFLASVTLTDGSVHYLHFDSDADMDAYSAWSAAGRVVRIRPLVVRWDPYGRRHDVPLEEYVPEGWEWDGVYPNVIGAGDGSSIGMKFAARTAGAPPDPERVDLWSATADRDDAPPSRQTFEGLMIVEPQNNGAARLYQSIARHDDKGLPFYYATSWLNDQTIFGGQGLISAEGPLVEVPARTSRQVMNGNTSSVFLEPPAESLMLLAKADGTGYELRSLGTSLVHPMGEKLALDGVPGLLATEFQESAAMKERPSAASIIPATGTVAPRGFSTSAARAEWTHKDNAFLPYFREVFFQVPFLIADHFNSQQKFADAQRWYHYVFDPTARDGTNERKRPWRYREFRDTAIQDLRAALTNRDALDAYRKDPFNPHAIARVRPGAYQKSIFMKYIDNLLDWGDALFAQFTMESVNEATMLYVMAADLLGPRPTELGPCGEKSTSPKTYADIAPLLRPANPEDDSSAEVLIEEFETFTIDPGPGRIAADQFVYPVAGATATFTAPLMARTGAVAAGNGLPAADDGVEARGGVVNPMGWNATPGSTWRDPSGTSLTTLQAGGPIGGAGTVTVGGQSSFRLPFSGDPVGPPETSPTGGLPTRGPTLGGIGFPKGLEPDDYLHVPYDLHDAPPPSRQRPGDREPTHFQPAELAHSRLIFCIPENKELAGYWDRVESRLNNIRNCMDISGVRRRLELFAPEIDPRMLVRMRAAGLSLDDVMNVASGSVPPYRFSYLIEKAKQQAALVQTFGNQLLAAIERRDGEELTRLRTVHEQNLLKVRSQSVDQEIRAAEDTLDSLRRQQTAVEYRRNHYIGLLQGGLLGPERVQQVATHLASTLASIEAMGALVSAIASLVPNFGAPTAITFGGVQISSCFNGFADFARAVKDSSHLVGASAGIEANYQRRDEDWKHQVELARQELNQLAKQVSAAEIRLDIAREAKAVHERSIEQVQEIFDLLRDRFTNFGRFTWLSAELQKLHRMAFNGALSMARLAEQACRFERPDETVQPLLTGDYWDASHAGLLAGDRLTLDLHNLERRYVETNHRALEIEQSFSLARFNPNALSALKTDATCNFEIPEWFFDLTYPGHYRRRIKAVRLTIPCVVGPHTNVGATLRLTASSIRKDARIDSQVAVPLRQVTAIAASVGQSDAGVFEFNFRDERYMPFEGAGVNSTWQLSLPKSVKPFDYRTISDAILRISYTAEEHRDLRTAVEDATGVLARLADAGVTRMLSLREDFPDAWRMLVEGAAQVEVDIRDVHIPFFMSAFQLAPAPFDVLVAALPGQNPVYPTLTFGGSATSQAGADAASALYLVGRTTALTVVAKHTLRITALGSASRPINGGGTKLDESKIRDILLRVPLKRAAPPVVA